MFLGAGASFLLFACVGVECCVVLVLVLVIQNMCTSTDFYHEVNMVFTNV